MFLHRAHDRRSLAARNRCDALNSHKAIVLPKTSPGSAQIAVSTMLAPNLLQAKLCLPSTVDTALEIWRHLRGSLKEFATTGQATIEMIPFCCRCCPLPGTEGAIEGACVPIAEQERHFIEFNSGLI
jgi:hypothetical protein